MLELVDAKVGIEDGIAAVSLDNDSVLVEGTASKDVSESEMLDIVCEAIVVRVGGFTLLATSLTAELGSCTELLDRLSLLDWIGVCDVGTMTGD